MCLIYSQESNGKEVLFSAVADMWAYSFSKRTTSQTPCYENFSALKSHVKCELLDMKRKMELLTNGISNGFHCQSCENLKENLSFLQRELLAKDEFIKSLLETQAANLKPWY